jgi:hypothetical protein
MQKKSKWTERDVKRDEGGRMKLRSQTMLTLPSLRFCLYDSGRGSYTIGQRGEPHEQFS